MQTTNHDRGSRIRGHAASGLTSSLAANATTHGIESGRLGRQLIWSRDWCIGAVVTGATFMATVNLKGIVGPGVGPDLQSFVESVAGGGALAATLVLPATLCFPPILQAARRRGWGPISSVLAAAGGGAVVAGLVAAGVWLASLYFATGFRVPPEQAALLSRAVRVGLVSAALLGLVSFVSFALALLPYVAVLLTQRSQRSVLLGVMAVAVMAGLALG